MSKEHDARFAEDWINAWNAHDLNRILSHYADDIAFTSPFVVKLLGISSGSITGKDQLRDYFAKGLAAYPDLQFTLLDVFEGVDSVILHYQSVKNLRAAEMMLFDKRAKIIRVIAHYLEDI